MAPGPSFAAALVAGIRHHGSRPASPGGPTWESVADDARELSLGLVDAGWGEGTRVRVRPLGLAPHTLVAREAAVLSAGATLALDDATAAEVTLSGDRVSGPDRASSVGALRSAGAARAAEEPDAHEQRLAALASDVPAVVGRDLAASHGELGWALRSVRAWLVGAVRGGPDVVLAQRVDPTAETAAVALVGRWWPATEGAALVGRSADRRSDDLVATLRTHHPDLVVLSPDGWRIVVDAVRAEAARSRPAAALLRNGRVAAAAGDEPGRRARAARRWSGGRLQAAAGLDALAVGICTGGLGVVDARDLVTLGRPVASTWIDPSAPAPVAATTLLRPAADRWGRPLPGRRIELGGRCTVHGGDVGAGLDVARHPPMDARGRVAIGAPR